MRNLLRNQRTVWCCLYGSRTPILDGDGHDTGETAIGYAAPVAVRANVSTASGDATQEAFGIGVAYDKVAQLPGTGWPMDERTVVYVDRTPPGSADYAWDAASGAWVAADGTLWQWQPTDAEADYAVVRVAESLNQTSLALRKVRD